MHFFSLKNLSSVLVSPCDPSQVRAYMPSHIKTKEQFSEWVKNIGTDYCFYSAFEGLNSSLRVGTENPPFKMHGLVADYDRAIAAIDPEDLLRNAVRDARPSWATKTFSSHARVVWEFEEPLLIHASFITPFLKRIAKELKIPKISGGLDDKFYEPAQYYALGTDWTRLSTDRVPTTLLHSLLFEVSARVDFAEEGPTIPIATIAAEVERRFPGRWQGAFDIGSRGIAFWDPSARNHTAAIVREQGMQCFSGEQPFVPWRQIFGHAFVRDFLASKVTHAVSNVWFDGKTYFKLDSGDVWVERNRQDIMLHLKASGLSNEVVEHVSELEEALLYVQDHHQVDAALHLIHAPEGINVIAGQKFLNISPVKVVNPSPVAAQWGEQFPWLARFLESYFDPPEQLHYFLAWLKRFYESALDRKLLPGQAIFIAGAPGIGKTFLSNVMTARLLGGYADAASFLLGESGFNKHLFRVALWAIDDTTPAADPNRHAMYSAIVKKITANHSFLYHPKFKDAIMVPWKGRIIVTCNLDSESTRILPDVDQSLLDKISLFKAAARDFDFTGAAEAVDAELPFFGSWLKSWIPPHETMEATRFGVTCYHHPQLLQAARDASGSVSFLELIIAFLRAHFVVNGSDAQWRGSCTELLQQMSADDGLRMLASKLTAHRVGRMLGQLEAQGYDVKYERGNYGIRNWVLHKALIEDKRKDTTEKLQ